MSAPRRDENPAQFGNGTSVSPRGEEDSLLRPSKSSSPSSEGHGLVTSASTDSSRRRLRCTPRVFEGAILLFLVNVIWVAASEVVQYIYNDLSFNKPFFLTYVSNSLFMVLFPMQRGLEAAQAKGYCTSSGSPPLSPSGYNWKQTAKVSLIISPMWFLAQGSYNWSLNATSVASSTILSTTSCLFTMLFSVCVLREKVTPLRLIGVVITIGGAVCVALNDKNSGEDHFYGDMICLFSAVMYGVYTTAIRYYIPDERTVKMSYFFSFLGAFNALGLLPMVLVMHYTGVENIQSLTPQIFGFIVLKGLFDNVLSDMLWARSIMLTSPTVATVGLALTIPLSMLADWMLKSDVPKPLLWLGSFLVLIGFTIVSVDVQPPPAVVRELATAPLRAGDIVAMEIDGQATNLDTVPILSEGYDSTYDCEE